MELLGRFISLSPKYDEHEKIIGYQNNDRSFIDEGSYKSTSGIGLNPNGFCRKFFGETRDINIGRYKDGKAHGYGIIQNIADDG